MSWKKIGPRSYEYKLPNVQAFVFGANRPNCLWAWSVHWSGGHASWVEVGFRRAMRKAEECCKSARPPQTPREFVEAIVKEGKGYR
jgi:hypothetical protein